MDPLHCDCCGYPLDADAANYDGDTGLLLCAGCDIAPLDDTFDMDMGPAGVELDIFGPWPDADRSLMWF